VDTSSGLQVPAARILAFQLCRRHLPAAAIRRSSSGRSRGNKKVDLPGEEDLCPSCLMPFDKNRKPRLID